MDDISRFNQARWNDLVKHGVVCSHPSLEITEEQAKDGIANSLTSGGIHYLMFHNPITHGSWTNGSWEHYQGYAVPWMEVWARKD